jgi:putative Mg2+ transporter-C (MgtC) family protein
MSTTLDWVEIAYRLALTLVAGALLGLNRWERGRAAGLRTTMLVTLAASVAMIQANLLMSTVGKARDSFVVIDLMRFPLGILSGIGFIGAGVILRRGRMIVGVTTAATMWLATVIGLAMGGGQTGLGSAALVLALIILWCFRRIEQRLRRERRGTLVLTLPDSDAVRHALQTYLTPALGFHIVSWTVRPSQRQKIRCEIRWRPLPNELGVPAFVDELSRRADVLRLAWREVNQGET